MNNGLKNIREYSRMFFLFSFLFGCLFAFALFKDNVFIERDINRYFIPMWSFGVESVESGEIPFWNPYIYCGNSFFASLQTCVFYPLTVIFYITGVVRGINLYIVIHLVLAAFFMYCWMRSIGVKKAGSFFAAVGYALSGTFMGMINLTIVLCAATFFPLVLLSYKKVLESDRFKRMIALALSLSFMFLAGDPAVCYITLFIIALYTCFKLMEDALSNKRIKFDILWKPSAAVLLFVSLVSFQLLPFVEKALESNHSGMTFEQVTYWSLAPRHMLEFGFPHWSMVEQVFRAEVKAFPWLGQFYSGIVLLVFAFISLGRLRDRRVQLALLLLLFSMSLMLGSYSYVYRIFYHAVPFADAVRYPVRFTFVFVFALATLGGLGIEFLLTERDRGFRTLFNRFLPIFAVALLLCILVFSQAVVREKLHVLGEEWILSSEHAASAETGFKLETNWLMEVGYGNFMHVLHFLFFTFLGLFVFIKYRISRQIGVWLFCSLLIFDLTWAGIVEQPSVMADDYVKPVAAVQYLKDQKPCFRFTSSPMLFAKSYGKKVSEPCIAHFKSSREMLALNDPMFFGLQSFSGYTAITSRNVGLFIYSTLQQRSPRDSRLLDLANVRYIVAPKSKEAEGFSKSFSLVYENDHLVIYENLNVLPRAFLVEKGEFVKDREEAMKLLKRKDFEPQEVVYLEGDGKGFEIAFRRRRTRLWRAAGTSPPRNDGSGSINENVAISSYGNHEVLVQVTADRPKWLFLGDAYEKNWHAEVNGEPVRVYNADVLFRAVQVPAGESEVRFFYVPRMFYIGCGISLFALILMLAVGFAYRRKVL